MPRESESIRLKLLERLDLSLAARLSTVLAGVDAAENLVEGQSSVLDLSPDERVRWIRGVLQMRGLAVHDATVRETLAGAIEQETHETKLVRGLERVLDSLFERGRSGLLPNGWYLAEVFRRLVRDLKKFGDHNLRKDVPWDAIAHVSYPPPAALPGLLDTFTPANRYRDVPVIYDRLHPVRRSFRLMWRLARIAPFPDHNLIMAFVAMNSFLLSSGYPLVMPEPTDRDMLATLVSGPPPRRVVQYELRMLESL